MCPQNFWISQLLLQKGNIAHIVSCNDGKIMPYLMVLVVFNDWAMDPALYLLIYICILRIILKQSY